MNTTVEEKRSLHEERDRIEQAIVNEILGKKTSHRDKLDSEHRQKLLLDRYMKCSKTLHELYEKTQSIIVPEPYDNTIDDFYKQLRGVKEFYLKNSNEQAVTLAGEFEQIEVARLMATGMDPSVIRAQKHEDGDMSPDRDSAISGEDMDVDQEGEIERLTKGLPTTDLVQVQDNPDDFIPQPPAIRNDKLVEFTDEEGYGRYLDLNETFIAFLQVIKKEETKPNYLQFLDTFDRFDKLDRKSRLTSSYRKYIDGLLNYLRDYCRRARPLFDGKEMESKAHEKFLEQWKLRAIPAWFDKDEKLDLNAQPMIDLDSYKTVEELKELGLDCLKQELKVRGLKCGGTIDERAERLWSVKGKKQEEYSDASRVRPGLKKGKKKSVIEPFVIAEAESKVAAYARMFDEHRQATIENVQRKQARTAEENILSDEDDSDLDDDDNSDDNIVYNPKNLPLGWDGKPIPYWLYKLHGLNQSYTCEICGNATYKGPKTFQRHFAEWRHGSGMKSLGIPNTAHFANITEIKDAIALWDKLKNERQRDRFNPLTDEEFEDSQGNVINKKIYEDLKRQGLL